MSSEPVVQRCCTRHDDVGQLTQHLIRDFSQVDARRVTREVARAVAAVAWIGLKQDQVLMTELVARVQLELNCGRRDDAARLAPQPHPGRRRTPSASRPVAASAW